MELTLDVRHQRREFGVLSDETLQSTADHGVLAHQDNSLATQSDTDLVHLLRADIVDTDDEDSAVLIEQGLQLIEVSGLGCGLAPHFFLFDLKIGCLRTRVMNWWWLDERRNEAEVWVLWTFFWCGFG